MSQERLQEYCIAVNGAHIWYSLDLVIRNSLALSPSSSPPSLSVIFINVIYPVLQFIYSNFFFFTIF